MAAQFGPDALAAKVHVSRETLDRLKIHVDLLKERSRQHNLVSQRSLDDVWRRHVWDSAQLVAFVPPGSSSLVDLGSGAGFPGLVLATLLGDRVSVVLYEATRKKAEFLAVAAHSMGLSNVEVRNARIEDAANQAVDVVTARALAPLDKLLGYAAPFSTKKSVCLFLKGQSVAAELTQARKSWRMRVSQHPSMTDSSGVILEIQELGHVGARPRPKEL